MSVGHHGLEDGRDYRLTIGSSFHPSKAKDAYHLMRYDFKPASIDTSRPAVFVVGEHNQCTVTIPNIQEGDTTTYKGGKKPCTKECVLIIDKEAGTITLERISSSVPLKKCRADKPQNKISSVPSKPNKPGSTQNVSKSSAATHNTSTPSTRAPINTASTTMSAAVTSTNSSSSNLNSNHGKRKSTVKKQRLMSDMSVSSSSSYSSDSDGDSLGNKLEAQLSAAKQPKAERAPVKPVPGKIIASKPKSQKSMFSTLQSDLQLSDSNDSDSD